MRDIRYHNWLFHYNHYTGKWNAFHREDAAAYWNGEKTKYPVYSNVSFTMLIEEVDKCL